MPKIRLAGKNTTVFKLCALGSTPVLPSKLSFFLTLDFIYLFIYLLLIDSLVLNIKYKGWWRMRVGVNCSTDRCLSVVPRPVTFLLRDAAFIPARIYVCV